MDKQYAPIGTISEGTLRTEDLLEAFADELKTAMQKYEWQGMTDKAKAFSEFGQLIVDAQTVDVESEEAVEIVGELIDALDSFSPPYCSFGSHEGNGSDFGWWPMVDAESLEDAKSSGYRVDVSDHGNVTLYDASDREVWAAV